MDTSTPVKSDNSVLDTWDNSQYSVHRSKHMDIKNHFLKHTVENGHANVDNLKSDNNEFDEFTEPLGTQKLENFRKAGSVQQHCWVLLES